jgi:hypothetical protein
MHESNHPAVRRIVLVAGNNPRTPHHEFVLANPIRGYGNRSGRSVRLVYRRPSTLRANVQGKLAGRVSLFQPARVHSGATFRRP